MPQFKCTLLLEVRKSGWSESFYLEAGSLQAADNKLMALKDVRKDLLSENATIIGARVTMVGGTRVSNLTSLESESTLGAETGLKDIPATGLLLSLKADGGYVRSFYLHGAPDFWQRYNDAGKFDDPHPEMRKQLKRFVNKLNSEGFQLRVISTDGADTAPVVVTAIAGVGADIIRYTAPGHAFTAGQVFKVIGSQGVNVKQFNGLRRAMSVVAATSIDVHQEPVSIPFTYTGGATVLKRVVKYVNILGWETATQIGSGFVRFGTRKVGRAFFVPAGRRRRAKASP